MAYRHDHIAYDREDDIWLPVSGYEDYYVSKSGMISGPGRHGEREILSESIGKNGHRYVSLYKKGIRHKEYVHRLVANAFVPNPNNYNVVRHMDDSPDNNDADNLLWGTQRDNILDMRRSGNDYRFTDKDRERAFSKRRTPIIATNIKTGEEFFYISQQEASRQLRISQSDISSIVSNKPGRHTTKGFTFRYATEDELYE